MANPFGIEQVDVPGILGVYQGAQDRRVNQLLLQRKMAAEDRAIENQHTISSIWKNYQDPTKGGGQSSTATGTTAPTAPAASPSLSSAYAPPTAPLSDLAGTIASAPGTAPAGAPATPTTAPAAAAGATPSPLANLPPVNPASVTPDDQSFVQANEQGIRQLMGLNADEGMKFLKFAQSMDADKRAKIVDAQDAIHTAAAAVQKLPYDQRKAAILQQAPDLLAAHPGLTPQAIQGFDPTDQNIQTAIAKSIGIKGIMDYAEKTATQAETHRHNVADEANSANNGYLNAGLLPPGSSEAVSADGPNGTSGAVGQRYTGGWTPRARNGGDNSDAAVDGKISGAAKFLGVAPSADISHLPPLKIAQAMTLSEGGPGSLADKNNNPANIRNGDGSFKVFPTREAGLQAAAALVQRKISQGQTTVQSMIEGLPKGGAQSAPASGLRIIPGGKLDQSSEVQLDEAGMNLAAEQYRTFGTLPAIGMGKAAATLRAQIISRAAKINTDSGISASDAMGNRADFHANQAALTTLSRTAAQVLASENTARANGQQVLTTMGKGAAGSGVPILNKWIQAGRTSVAGDADASRFNLAVQTFATEYAKVVSGATGGAVTSDSARHEIMGLINNAQTPQQLQAVISQANAEMANRRVGLEGQQNALRTRLGSKPGAGASTAKPTVSNW